MRLLRFRSVCVIAAAIAIHSLAPLAQAYEFKKVAVTGDAIPGVPGATVNNVFQNKLSDNGEVFVAVNAVGSGINSTNDLIGLHGAPDSPSLLFREGDQVPGQAPGALFNPTGSSGGERISSNGNVMFTYSLAQDSGLGITTANDSVFWYGKPGNITPIMREGDAAPGAGGALYGSLSPFGAVTTTNKTLIQQNLLTGTAGVTSTNDTAVFYGNSPTNLNLLVREGTQAPDVATGALINSFTNSSSLARGNHVLISGALRQGTGGVTSADDSITWATNTSGELKVILRENMNIPETPGLVPAGTQLFAQGERAFNSQGKLLAYNAELKTAAGLVDANNNRLVMIGTVESGMTTIAREGSPAPGLPGVTWGNSFGESRLSETGTILLQNTLIGAGVTSANDASLFIGTDANDLHLIVREGSQAPGFAPGVNFSSWGSSSFDVNDNGVLAVLAAVTDGADYFNNGLFATNPSTGLLELLVKNGDSLETAPGVFKEIQSLNFSASETQQGLNNINQIAFSVGFTDGSEGLYVTSVPEPSTLVLAGVAAVGLLTRFRRRRAV